MPASCCSCQASLPLPIAGAGVPVSSSPVALKEPRSRTPPKHRELALNKRPSARVARHLWLDPTVDAAENAGPAREGNPHRSARGEVPRQWARYLNQATLEIEDENNKLRLELAFATRWIKLREQWWMSGVQNMQTAAGNEISFLFFCGTRASLKSRSVCQQWKTSPPRPTS